MKYVVIVSVAFIIFIGILYLQKTKTDFKQSPDQTTTPTIAIFPSDSAVTIQDRTYSIYWQRIEPKGLTLVPNFDEKKTASQIMEENGCSYGANGGFYTTDYKPIGLFRTQNSQLSQATINTTMNGFFSKNSDSELTISRSAPADYVLFTLQSGPYMTSTSLLSIKNDSYNRRTLVARTQGNTWYFIAIIEKDNSFSGPKLSDVPKILGKLPLHIVEALNLDGGSASALYNDKGIRFGELTPIGSFFCGK